MEWWTWITYVGVITALIIFPGPVALLCTTHGLRFGRHRAFATVRWASGRCLPPRRRPSSC